jgi:hypothetical protein
VVRFLEMHMYITSALQKTDMKAVGLQLALELLHEKVKTRVTKRCRLSSLTNSALVIRVQMRGEGGDAGYRPMSTAVHIT